LVDDAVLITERIAEMLRELKFVKDIFVAHNFESGVEATVRNKPDIILLDIHLPGKSGIELLEIVKKDFPTIKVLMVTNKVSEYYKEMCIEKGADHFIDKSKEFENIPTILNKYYSD
jgi:DNA-binding NarL/FixJ family response regulator